MRTARVQRRKSLSHARCLREGQEFGTVLVCQCIIALDTSVADKHRNTRRNAVG